MEATSQSHAQPLQGDDIAAMSSLKKKEAGYGCDVVGKIVQNHTDGKPEQGPLGTCDQSEGSPCLVSIGEPIVYNQGGADFLL